MKRPLITDLSQETINVANRIQSTRLIQLSTTPKGKICQFSQVGIKFNKFIIDS